MHRRRGLGGAIPRAPQDSALIATAVRCVTTGSNHSFRPGPMTRCLRAVFLTLTPKGFRARLASGLQHGMERVRILEQEQLWLHHHGSPLRVLGLPDHAELPEVRERYRDLLLQIHPDTSQPGEAGKEVELYHTVQAAYAMATCPTSLWHQNGAAPALHRSLVAGNSSSRRVTVFAVFSYIVMGSIAIVFSVFVVRRALDHALRLFDPTFYAFMVQQEAEEERQRLAGEVVDTDPKRLAPTVVKRLLYPGRFVRAGAADGEH
uniref:Uncharacterized protein TCIL3000_7_5040 n=1 Tax=Trypanosoma congolense (strain IL3000) TaxID=1068625 RepID=G0UQM9_TRYCI|nr:unnamed protein product [Trypanosoma congolense IL3000]